MSYIFESKRLLPQSVTDTRSLSSTASTDYQRQRISTEPVIRVSGV